MVKIYTLLLLLLLSGCTNDGIEESIYTPDQGQSGDNENDDNESSSEDLEINKYVDDLLSEYYLWNDEYITLERDLYQDYESFFYNTLLNMTTNTLDKKSYEGEYYLYSYIEREESSKSRSSDPETSLTFGFVNITPMQVSNTLVYFIVDGAHPNTPAATAGLKHGDIITSINDESITMDNYAERFYALMIPSSSESISYKLYESQRLSQTLTPEICKSDPIIMSEVYEQDGQKIGYLNYTSFEIAYDNDLITELTKFKSAGITDLVLDLRYNGGGYVSSSNLLSSAIASSSGAGKVFNYYRLNSSRMKNPTSEARYFGASSDGTNIYDEFISSGNSTYTLNIPRLYCLISYRTASASELVISSLRGIDFEVVLIGEQSMGKNVGMEVSENISKGGYNYTIVPITFQNYNAKFFSDYADGFAPDYELDEYEYEAYPNYPDLGRGEPLLEAAITLITGGTITSSATRSSALGTTLPMNYNRLGGALVVRQEE